MASISMPQPAVLLPLEHQSGNGMSGTTAWCFGLPGKCATPINDFTTHGDRVDGHVLRDLYLFQVKSPAESHEPWDYFRHRGRTLD